jgi:hypothetical protein
MAVSTQAVALTEAHRIQQNQNGALVAYVVARLWMRSVDLNDISGSTASLVARLIPLIRMRRDHSALIARAYYTRFRQMEAPGGDGFSLPPITELNLPALQTSLRVMGEVALKKRIATLPLGDDIPDLTKRVLLQGALETTATDISGAATRHAMNGGRDEIQSALEADPVALGYIRVTDADPCYFCAMLASRGPVYDDESFEESDPRFIGRGEHKVHDHCGCGVEPVFDRKTAWPGKAKQAETAWIDLSRDLGRVPTIKDFRKRWEGRD